MGGQTRKYGKAVTEIFESNTVERPDMMSASKAVQGEADIVREVAWIL